MKAQLCLLLAVGVAACFGGAARGEPIYIVVNYGDYPSAEAAACDEANVKWDDGNDADDIICTESFAAVELQCYLVKMTGDAGAEQFPIVDDDKLPDGRRLILIGNSTTNRAVALCTRFDVLRKTPFDGLGREGYLIQSLEAPARLDQPMPNLDRACYPSSIHPVTRPVGSSSRQTTAVVMIGGEGRIGTLYGVYRFLDHFGVRWLSPGEIGEEVPSTGESAWPDAMDIREQPAFVTRGFHAWEDRGDADFYDWMARNRMNYWCVEASDRAGLKKRGIQMNCGNHVLQERFINPRNAYPYNHARFDGDEDRPADPYPISDDYRGDVDGDGKLTYSEAHPEWYGLRGGKRSFDIKGDAGDNFCTSNRYACDEFMKNTVQDLIDGQWKDADSINFWTLDGGKWCECDKCKALGTPTDRNLLLVHRLGQEMKRATAEGRLKRNVRIYFLAYADVLEPPTRPLPADFDYENCIATYYPIVRCYVHTFADPACTEFNTRYQEHFLGWFARPDRHYRGQVFIGEYYNVSGYKCLPVMFARTMAADIPYYYDHGARHEHYMHCTTKNWGTKSLTNWQFARMLWDPKLDTEVLLDDYFTKRYGPAAGVMRGLYERLDTGLSNVTMLKYRLSRRLSANEKDLFPHQHLKYEKAVFDKDDGPDLVEMLAAIDECLEILKQAGAINVPQRVRARLAEDAGPLQYAANTLHFYDVLVRAHELVQAGRRDEAAGLLPEMKRLAKALREDTLSTKFSSSHASAADALEASYVTKAYDRLVSDLEAVSK